MEMYKDDDQKNSIQDPYQSNEPPSFEHHPTVSRLRHWLLILIGTDLVLYVINFLFVIHSYASSESLESQSPNSSSQLALIIVFLIYYSFGFLVAYRYYQTGLFVFLLLGPISLFLSGSTLTVIIMRIIHTTEQMGLMTAGTIVAIIFVTLCILASILQIIFISFSWKLYRLLKNNQRLTIEQI